MKEIRETVCDHIEGNDYATYFSREHPYSHPYSWVTFPRPKKKRPPMSEEQRIAAAAERLAKGRESKIIANSNRF